MLNAPNNTTKKQPHENLIIPSSSLLDMDTMRLLLLDSTHNQQQQYNAVYGHVLFISQGSRHSWLVSLLVCSATRSQQPPQSLVTASVNVSLWDRRSSQTVFIQVIWGWPGGLFHSSGVVSCLATEACSLIRQSLAAHQQCRCLTVSVSLSLSVCPTEQHSAIYHFCAALLVC